jgi:hypothetical protein
VRRGGTIDTHIAQWRDTATARRVHYVGDAALRVLVTGTYRKVARPSTREIKE